MKNTIKWFGIVAIVAAIGFLAVSCGDGGDGGSNPGLDGNWTGYGATILFKGDKGVFSIIGSGPYGSWRDANKLNNLNIGDALIQEIKKTTDPKQWTGQLLLFNGTHQKTGYRDCRLTVSADGQRLTVFCSTADPTNMTFSIKK